MLRDISTEEKAAPRNGLGLVPTTFAIQGPKTVPRVDYERLFVLDAEAKLLGEYALRDDCPLEYGDLRRAIPVDGLRHLAVLYQGEYAFTPFRVEDLWFVLLTRGVPRIEERGSFGTLIAAMRVHLPPSLLPTLASHEAALDEREAAIKKQESNLVRREERLEQLEANLRVAGTKIAELEADVKAREARLNFLRDYALQLQEAFHEGARETKVSERSASSPPAPRIRATPPG